MKHLTMASAALLASMMMVLASSRTHGAVSAGNAERCDPLLTTHLVVRGTVTNVTQQLVTLAEWGLVPPNDRVADVKIHVVLIHVSVADVLKGKWTEREIVFRVRDQPSLLKPGNDYIICALWKKLKTGGVYVTEPALGWYSKNADKWVDCKSVEGSQPEEFSGDEIVSRIRAVDVDHVTASADVIARGVIVKRWVSNFELDGHAGRLLNFEMQTNEILKGHANGGVVRFVVPDPGAEFVPSWYRCIPTGVAVGQQWFVFLREGQLGLYPFAGLNGLLRVDGNDLIYDMTVKHPLGVDKFDQLVRKRVSNAKTE